MKTQPISREDLYSLEQYAAMRNEFRIKVMSHKKNRRLELCENVVLHFEDRLIMQYQIQEMLRAEKIFEADGIEEELETYNPMIPDGSNFKATMMIQYPVVEQRQAMLTQLIGIENKTWVQINGHEKVYAIADEDLERDNENKTSAVHFMRFELSPEMIADYKSGADLNAGVDHENYNCSVTPVAKNIADSLRQDLN